MSTERAPAPQREGSIGEAAAAPVHVRPPAARRVVRREPSQGGEAASLLADAREAMGYELKRLRLRAAGPEGLGLNDVRNLSLLADAACKLAREEREALKAEDLGDLSDDELKAEAAKVLEAKP